MRVTVRLTALVLALSGMGAASLWASDPAYAGRWKLNLEKSEFQESTVTYEQLDDGRMKFTSDGQSYSFKTDGQEVATPWGNSVAWEAVDERTWSLTSKVGEKVVGTATLELADDGKTLSVDAKNIDASGKASKSKAVFHRLSGDSGLAGQWKTEHVSNDAPGTMSISAHGSDGLTLAFVEDKGTCSASFDGKDYPADGPVWPSGWTCAIAKKGEKAFELTWKRNGNVMYEETLTLSEDGKTLANQSKAPGSGETVKIVYDRE